MLDVTGYCPSLQQAGHGSCGFGNHLFWLIGLVGVMATARVFIQQAKLIHRANP